MNIEDVCWGILADLFPNAIPLVFSVIEMSFSLEQTKLISEIPSNNSSKEEGGQNPRNSFSSSYKLLPFFYSFAAVTSFRYVNKMRHTYADTEQQQQQQHENMFKRNISFTLAKQHSRRYNFVYTVITLNTWSQFKIALLCTLSMV